MAARSFALFITLPIFFCALAGAGGCEAFGQKATYSMLIDQVYYTRGASEAMLGAYGIEDNLGIDSFEREGPGITIPEEQIHIRSVMQVAVETANKQTVGGKATIEIVDVDGRVGNDDKQTRKMTLLILDLHKDWLVDEINTNATLLAKLKEDPHYRIITAVAVLLDYADQSSHQGELTLTAEDKANAMRGELKFSELKKTDLKLSSGTVYAYQYSIPCFALDGRLRYLKTDRPGDADRLPMNTRSADGSRRESRKAEPTIKNGK